MLLNKIMKISFRNVVSITSFRNLYSSSRHNWKVGLIGCRWTGRGVAVELARVGSIVTIFDDTASHAAMLYYARSVLSSLQYKSVLTPAEKDDVLKRIEFASNIEDVIHCDAIIDMTRDDLFSRQKLLSLLSVAVPSDKPILTCTHLKLDDVARYVRGADRIIRCRFLNPVFFIPTVELYSRPGCDPSARVAAAEMVRRMGKELLEQQSESDCKLLSVDEALTLQNRFMSDRCLPPWPSLFGMSASEWFGTRQGGEQEVAAGVARSAMGPKGVLSKDTSQTDRNVTWSDAAPLVQYGVSAEYSPSSRGCGVPVVCSDVQQSNDSFITITFSLPAGVELRAVPGQVCKIQWAIPRDQGREHIDGETEVELQERYYAILDPRVSRFSIGVELPSQGGATTRFLAANAAPGLTATLLQTFGNPCLLHDESSHATGTTDNASLASVAGVSSRFLFVAGGTGITPLFSMMKWLCEEGANVTLLYSHKGPDAPFVQELLDMARMYSNCTVWLYFTRHAPSPSLPCMKPGHITSQEIQQRVPDIASRHMYTLGPVGFMRFVTASVQNILNDQFVEFMKTARTGPDNQRPEDALKCWQAVNISPPPAELARHHLLQQEGDTRLPRS
jgi:ferredoxin-NADP reductase